LQRGHDIVGHAVDVLAGEILHHPPKNMQANHAQDFRVEVNAEQGKRILRPWCC
jgi:hypothetical protein